MTTSAPAGEKGTAVIKGKVVYEGTVKPVVVQMNAKPECETLNKDKKPPVVDPGKLVYAKDGNAVPDVFVYAAKGVKDKWDAPKEPVVLDQKDCMYVPHVMGMIAGQPIKIINSDPLNHNVHSLAGKNPQFNFAQSNKGMEKVLEGNDTFTKPEVGVKIKCDVHSWMSCYAFVLTHPFFDVTKGHLNDGGDNAKRGAFEIKELPAGKYTIEAWHENFGQLTQEVEVKDGETKEIEFKYSEKKAKAPEVREVILGAVIAGDEAAPSADASAAAK
jgi:plastocyanin